MAVEWLAGKRVRGTSSERTGLGTPLAFIDSSVSNSGCKAYYNFEQTSGSLTNQATTGNGFSDGLGSSADGTNSGATTGATGKVGSYAWSFSGSDSNVWINHTLSHSGMSVSVWVYPTTISGQHTIFIDDPNNLSTGSSMDLVLNSSGYFQFETYSGGWQSLNSTTTASVNNWYHVVVTEDGTNRKIYVNGSLENTSSVLSSSLNTGVRIGGDGYGGGVVNEFIGKFDELLFFNRALTSSEVSNIYNEQVGNPDIQDGTIFEESDTNKAYIWNASTTTWSQL